LHIGWFIAISAAGFFINTITEFGYGEGDAFIGWQGLGKSKINKNNAQKGYYRQNYGDLKVYFLGHFKKCYSSKGFL